MKIPLKNLNPKPLRLVTHQKKINILNLKHEGGWKMMFLFKGLFCLVAAFIFRLHLSKNSKALERPAASTSHCYRCSSPRHGAEPNHTDPIYPHQTHRIHGTGQWLFLVPVKGGRDYITSQKAIYKWYISGIYC